MEKNERGNYLTSFGIILRQKHHWCSELIYIHKHQVYLITNLLKSKLFETKSAECNENFKNAVKGFRCTKVYTFYVIYVEFELK